MIRRRRRATGWILPVALVVILLVAGFLAMRWAGSWAEGPEPRTIAQASLQSMQEQQRLTTLSARYQAVVTSTQERLGGLLSARKTLIMPGNVRYDVNLAALDQDDVQWDEATNTLSVTLPPIEVADPQIDLAAMQEFSDGRLLMSVTNAEDRLDAANRRAAQESLLQQARQPVPMRLARESAKRAIARSFAMPLRAAGVDANVAVRFADEPRGTPSYLDRSRSMEEVLGRPVQVKE